MNLAEAASVVCFLRYTLSFRLKNTFCFVILSVSEESRRSDKRRLLFAIHSKFRLQNTFCFVVLSRRRRISRKRICLLNVCRVFKTNKPKVGRGLAPADFL